MILMWQRRMVALQHQLIHAKRSRKAADRRLEAPRNVVELWMIQALVIHTPDPDDHQELAALGQERMLIDGTVDVDERIHRARFPVLFGDIIEPGQGCPSFRDET